MANPTTGELFISSVITHGMNAAGFEDPLALLREQEQKAWKFVKDFNTKNGVVPTRITVEAETGIALPDAKEHPGYYRDQLVDRYLHDRVRSAIDASKPFLEKMRLEPRRAYDTMLDELLSATKVLRGAKLFDARAMGPRVYDRVMRRVHSIKSNGIEFGWKYLDTMTDGLVAGDLASIVGRPGLGKTQLVLYSARHAWHQQRRRVLFFPLEMEVMQILTRLAGMETGIEAKAIRTGQISTREQLRIRDLKYTGVKQAVREVVRATGEVIEKEEDVPDHEPFWIVDAQLAVTPDDIAVLCRQLRPDVVYVDGAYLLEYPDPALGMYAKVAVVAKETKRISVEQEVPFYCSWQFNREGAKALKKGETPGLEHIAHADTIGQISRVVLGLFEPENVSTQRRRAVRVLKGREGEEGEFTIHWNWRRMDFSQFETDAAAPVGADLEG